MSFLKSPLNLTKDKRGLFAERNHNEKENSGMINTVQNNQKKISFKGNWVTAAASVASSGIKGIQNGGVLVDFCLVLD